MKEAAGEANLTVVAIILIGVVVAVVTPLVNSLMKSTAQRACCTDAGGYVKGSDCMNYGADGATVPLKNIASDGTCDSSGTATPAT